MLRNTGILEMAQGAIMEQANMEVGKIIENILDPNTEAKKKRTLTLTVDFTPSSDRSTVVITANAKSKLLANNAIQTSIFVGEDKARETFVATEMTPNLAGQIDMNGEVLEEPKVIEFKKCGGMN